MIGRTNLEDDIKAFSDVYQMVINLTMSVNRKTVMKPKLFQKYYISKIQEPKE